jgi:hypothetical protein
MDFNPYLRCILTMCMKLDTAVQEMLLSLPEFRDSRCSESQRLLKGVNDMLPYFVPFHPMYMKFGTGDVHKNILIDLSFMKIYALKVIIYLRTQVNVLC